jgi:phage-related holin
MKQSKAKLQQLEKHIIVLFVETPHKFITAVINLRGVSTNKTIIYFIAMQTYKELIT